MKRFVIAIIAICFLGAPGSAGAPTIFRLSNDSSQILNYRFVSDMDQDGIAWHVLDLPPSRHSKYDDHCEWHSIVFSYMNDDGTYHARRYPAVCNINSSQLGGPLYMDEEVWGDHLMGGNIERVVFFAEEDGLAVYMTAEDHERQKIPILPLSQEAARIAFELKEPESVYVSGIATLRRYEIEIETAEGSAKNHIFALHEIIPPYRHASYMVDLMGREKAFIVFKEGMDLNERSYFDFEIRLVTPKGAKESYSLQVGLAGITRIRLIETLQ